MKKLMMSDHTVISIDMLYVCYVRRLIYLFFRFFEKNRPALRVSGDSLSLNTHEMRNPTGN